MNRQTSRVLAATVTVGLAFTLVPVSATFANDGESLDSLLNRVAPEVREDLYNPVFPQNPEVTPATVPESPGEPVTTHNEDGVDLSVWLPDSVSTTQETVAGVPVTTFDHGDGATSVPLVKADGSVQIMTVLESSAAPESYRYGLDLPEGATIAMDDEGFVSIAAIDGSFLGGIAPAWAVDANAHKVPTWYEIEGATVTQVIDHVGVVSAYPIVADPWLGQDLYYTPYVDFPSQGYRVNVTPRSWGQTWNGVATWWAHRDEVVSKLGSSSWRWTDTIQEQFYCHIAGLPYSLPEYNLDSWRPFVGWAESLVSYGCNPYDGTGS